MKHGMKMITPAADWRDALPCGDGSLCALVYGGLFPETILFNHDRLWYKGEVMALPDLSGEFAAVREMGLHGNVKGANDHISSILRAQNFNGLVPIFHPALDLKIKTPQKLLFQNYGREVDFSSGETRVAWQQGDIGFVRKFFISRTRHIGVMHFNAGSGLFDTAFQLCEHDLSDSFGMDNVAQIPPLTYISRSAGNKLFLNVSGSDGGQYGAVLKIIAVDGQLDCSVENTWADQTSSLPLLWDYPMEKRATIHLSGISSVTAIIGFYINVEDSEEAQQRTEEMLDGISLDYEELLEEHRSIHSELFNRLTFEPECEETVNPENEYLLLEAYSKKPSMLLYSKLFDIGRYLLMCCSNEDGLPPTLQGTFNGDYFPPWNSFYVHNENTQMYYWQALPGGMPELMGAFFKYFEGFVQDYQTNARNLFGCRGIFIPLVAAANTGLLQDPQPHVINFISCAAWISFHFYDYYLFTGDKDFLVDHAIPFMEQTALFYEDYLQIGEDGRYFIFPSNSPENSPKSSFDADTDLSSVMNPGIPTTYDSTIDTALAKELLTNLCRAYAETGIHADNLARYTAMLARFKEYRINDDHALAEWIDSRHTDNYAHRHLSHIYPFFPGNEFIAGHQDSLIEAAGIAVDKRMEEGLASQTGWSLVHLANIYARLGRSDKARNCLEVLTKTCVGSNLFTYHNDYRNMGTTLKVILGKGAPFQIDANMGFASAIIEMFVYSDTSSIYVAKALPRQWRKGRIGSICTRCGCKADIEWDFDKRSLLVSIISHSDRSIRIILPDGCRFDERNEILITMGNGQIYQFAATYQE